MKSGLVKTRLNPMLEKIGFCADYSIKIVETWSQKLCISSKNSAETHEQ